MRPAGLGLALLAVVAFGAEEGGVPDAPVRIVHDLPSPHQAGGTRVEVLLPDELEAERRYPVLYLLPVVGKGGTGKRPYGDPIALVRAAGIHRRGVICVFPGFSIAPWYGDHANDPQVAQERHLLETVLPFIDATYPTRPEAEGRWLLGFSKSGWGATTLLLRHPEAFGYAAVWDAPLMLDGSGDDWGPMGLSRVFGTKDAMLTSLPTSLVRERADHLQDRPRLVLGVGHYWRAQTTRYHALLDEFQVPHVWRDDLTQAHRWDSGWLAPMAEALIAIATAP